MTATHYTLTDQGGWFALVHDRRALLVQASPERALELWPALVAGADALLDRLTADGLSATPSFAFAEADADGGLRTILRGPVAATVTTAAGPTERSGAGAATWRDDADALASAVQLRHDGGAFTGRILPIVSGVAATASVTLQLDEQGVAAAAPSVSVAAPAPPRPGSAPQTSPADPQPVPAPAIDQQPFSIPPFAPSAPSAPAAPAAPAASIGAATPVEPEEGTGIDNEAAGIDDEAGADDEIDERTTVLPPRRPGPQPSPASEHTVLPEQTILPSSEPASEPAEESPAEADQYDYLFGSTVVRPVADAAVHEAAEGEEPAAAPTPVTEQLSVPADGDHDGHTVMAADLAELRARRREQGSEPAPVAAPAPALHLLRHDGIVESLDQPVLVGRAPSVSQVPGGRIPRLVTVNSLGQDISRNHVQFTVEGGTVVVTDLHSRNGTHVVMPGKSPQKLRQGEPTAVIAGTVIDLGGGVTFTVSED